MDFAKKFIDSKCFYYDVSHSYLIKKNQSDVLAYDD